MRILGAFLATTVAACSGATADPPPSIYVVDRVPGTDFTVAPDSLVFPAAGNEALLAYAPGDVLVCARGEGFVRKIVSVTASDQAITIATTQATVADALDDGTFDHHTTPPRAGKSDGSADGFRGFSYGLGNVTVPGDYGLQIDVTGGHFQLDPDLDVHLDVHQHEVQQFRAVASGLVDASLAADVEVNGHIDHSSFIPLKQWSYPQVQLVGYVPVVEVIQLTVGVGFEVKAEGHAKIHLGGSAHGQIKAGASYDAAAGWQPVEEQAFDFTPDTHVVEGDLQDLKVSGFVYGEVSVKLYDIVGPAIRVMPYVAIEHTQGENGWTPSVGAQARFDVVLNFLRKKEWVPWHKVLFDVAHAFEPVFATPPVGDACNGITAEGVCADGVAVRCDNGALKIDDCALSGLGCALSGAAVACVSGCGELDYFGGCVDASLRWCDNGQVHTYECPATGNGCGWQDDTVGNNCL
jgi:hypothetical protein